MVLTPALLQADDVDTDLPSHPQNVRDPLYDCISLSRIECLQLIRRRTNTRTRAFEDRVPDRKPVCRSGGRSCSARVRPSRPSGACSARLPLWWRSPPTGSPTLWLCWGFLLGTGWPWMGWCVVVIVPSFMLCCSHEMKTFWGHCLSEKLQNGLRYCLERWSWSRT